MPPSVNHKNEASTGKKKKGKSTNTSSVAAVFPVQTVSNFSHSLNQAALIKVAAGPRRA